MSPGYRNVNNHQQMFTWFRLACEQALSLDALKGMVQPEPYNQPVMILVPRLLCSCFVIGLFLCWWLTSPCCKNLEYYFFGIFRQLQDIPMIWLWFWWILSKFAVCLFVCLLQRACNFGKSFEKCYPENFVFILFFSLFNCLLFWCPLQYRSASFIHHSLHVCRWVKDGALSWRPVRARTNFTSHVTNFY